MQPKALVDITAEYLASILPSECMTKLVKAPTRVYVVRYIGAFSSLDKACERYTSHMTSQLYPEPNWRRKLQKNPYSKVGVFSLDPRYDTTTVYIWHTPGQEFATNDLELMQCRILSEKNKPGWNKCNYYMPTIERVLIDGTIRDRRVWSLQEFAKL